MTSLEQNERHAHWQSLIIQQQKSGLSQKEFCVQHKLSLGKFSYYKSLMADKKEPKEKSAFSKIALPKTPSSLNYFSEIKVILPNGFQCVFSSLTDSAQMKQLVEVLLSC